MNSPKIPELSGIGQPELLEITRHRPAPRIAGCGREPDPITSIPYHLRNQPEGDDQRHLKQPYSRCDGHGPVFGEGRRIDGHFLGHGPRYHAERPELTHPNIKLQIMLVSGMTATLAAKRSAQTPSPVSISASFRFIQSPAAQRMPAAQIRPNCPSFVRITSRRRGGPETTLRGLKPSATSHRNPPSHLYRPAVWTGPQRMTKDCSTTHASRQTSWHPISTCMHGPRR